MMFTLAKERMEKSRLWQIIRRMPKGTLLHCHIEAMVDLDWAVEEAFKIDGMHIKAEAPLSDAQSILKTPFVFQYSNTSRTENSTSIWSAEYAKDTLIPLRSAADSFPNGGKEGFIKWLYSRWTITPEESLKHHLGVDEIWRKFMSCFPIVGSLIYYEPIYKQFIRRMLKQLLDDGVQYVELRSAFYTPFVSEGQEEPDVDYSKLFAAFDEALDEFQNSEEGKDFWGARYIWTTVRAFDTKGIINGRFVSYLFHRPIN
jgi:adenosine deaminase CECR1